MKLSSEEKAKVVKLSERASNLLVDILDDALLPDQQPTDLDDEFMKTVSEINSICPSLADGYVDMYNRVQEQKISPGDTYCKMLQREKK